MDEVLDYLIKNRKAILLYIRRTTKDKSSCEDIYQDAVEAVLKSKSEATGFPITAYAYACVNSAINKHARKGTSDREVELGEDYEGLDLTFVQLHNLDREDIADPLDTILREEETAKLPNIIASLGQAKHSDFLLMVLRDGVSIPTAAKMCDIPLVNARVIAHRIVRKVSSENRIRRP